MPNHSLSDRLNLFFPQWQGSGPTDDVYRGAAILRDRLADQITFVDVPVPPTQSISVEQGVLGHAVIVDQLSAALATLRQHQPQRVWTIGGDCGVEVAPIGYLNARYGGDLAVVWIDAHADLNTPESSPSHTFHGMPLRSLLGEGSPAITSLIERPLRPDQIFLVGVRDLDPPEQQVVDDEQIVLIPPPFLDPIALADLIRRAGWRRVYIHLDLDALDPDEFPAVMMPTPHGLTGAQIADLIDTVRGSFDQVGFSIVEYAPGGNNALDTIAPLVERFAQPIKERS